MRGSIRALAALRGWVAGPSSQQQLGTLQQRGVSSQGVPEATRAGEGWLWALCSCALASASVGVAFGALDRSTAAQCRAADKPAAGALREIDKDEVAKHRSKDTGGARHVSLASSWMVSRTLDCG